MVTSRKLLCCIGMAMAVGPAARAAAAPIAAGLDPVTYVFDALVTGGTLIGSGGPSPLIGAMVPVRVTLDPSVPALYGSFDDTTRPDGSGGRVPAPVILTADVNGTSVRQTFEGVTVRRTGGTTQIAVTGGSPGGFGSTIDFGTRDPTVYASTAIFPAIATSDLAFATVSETFFGQVTLAARLSSASGVPAPAPVVTIVAVLAALAWPRRNAAR